MAQYKRKKYFKRCYSNLDCCRQIPWYDRGSRESTHPLQMLIDGHVYTTTIKKVLLTVFSRRECCSLKWQNEKRMSCALTGLVDMGDLPRGVSAYGIQDPEGISDAWNYCWSRAIIGLHFQTSFDHLVDSGLLRKLTGSVWAPKQYSNL